MKAHQARDCVPGIFWSLCTEVAAQAGHTSAARLEARCGLGLLLARGSTFGAFTWGILYLLEFLARPSSRIP